MLTSDIRVIYLQDGLLAPLGIVFKLFTRKPVVITINGHDITYDNRLYQYIVPRCLQRLNKVVCISQAMKVACLKRGIKTEKTVVISYGISDEFDVGTDKEKLRNELAAKFKLYLGERKILLTVGRLVEKKGIHWFIEEVIPRLLDNSYIYLIAGSGILETAIRRSIKEHKLQNDVFLIGWADDDMLRLLYNSADVFVMPNVPVKDHMEGFGLVALEAASCGVPVVAAGPEDIKNAIQDGKNGFTVEPGNSQGFIDRINKLLEDDETRRAFGERARQYTLENYGWAKVAREYVEVFKDLSSS